MNSPGPLAGRRIVVTRSERQAPSMVAALEQLGAEIVAAPMIRIEPATDDETLLAATRNSRKFDWIIFTSVNGVRAFWSALERMGVSAEDRLTDVAVCAVGPATASAIEARGGRVELIPPESISESVVEAMAARGDLSGIRVLLVRPEVARNVISTGLRERGATVFEVEAYRTVADPSSAAQLRHALDRGLVDMVTFTSSSTVRHFAEQVGVDIGRAEVATIGPITSATARELGIPVHVEAGVHTTDGLREAIVSHMAKKLEKG